MEARQTARMAPGRWPSQVMLRLLLLLLLLISSCEAQLFSRPSPLEADERDLYGLLGVRKNAPTAQIKKAFRQLARENHPDLKDTDEERAAAKEFMTRLLRAYDVLSDDVKRQDFDQFGVVPGLADAGAAVTTDDIFRYYHQSALIPSKTPLLEEPTRLQAILRYRGRRLFLLQLFMDSSTACRRFSPAWELLTESKLVAGNVVKMLRINLASPAGETMAAMLGVEAAASVPVVVAVIDGEVWIDKGLSSLLHQKADGRIFSQLLGFVMDFFFDTHAVIKQIADGTVDDIAEWLTLPRDTTTPEGAAEELRVVMTAKSAESLPVALQLLYPTILIRVVRVAALLDFFEHYCEMDLAAVSKYGRSGMESSDIIAVSLAALPTSRKSCKGVTFGVTTAITLRKAEGLFAEALKERRDALAAPPDAPSRSANNDDDGDEDDAVAADGLRGFMLTRASPSATLSSEDDGTTVLTATGMAPLLRLTADNYLDVCARHCLLWLHSGHCDDALHPEARASPRSESERSIADFVRQDLRPFIVAVVCTADEPGVRDLLARPANAAMRRAGFVSQTPVLIAIVDGDDATVHVVANDGEVVDDGPFHPLMQRLADLIDVMDAPGASRGGFDGAAGSERDGDDDGDGGASPRVPFASLELGAPLQVSLKAAAFPLSVKQRWWISVTGFLSTYSMFINNVLPFVVMYFMHKKWSRSTAPAASAEAEAPAAAAIAPNKPVTAAAPSTAPTAPSPAGVDVAALLGGFGWLPFQLPKSTPPPKGNVSILSASDLQEARSGASAGYLVLILDERPLLSGPQELPAVASLPLFTMRLLTPAQRPVWRWVKSLNPANTAVAEAGGGASGTAAANAGLTIVAVRKGGSVAFVKPTEASLEAFLKALETSNTAELPSPLELPDPWP